MVQLIIFILGWPLEWSEILIIFVPIFLPMLDTFGVNPYFFAMLVALNLQTSFLTPPMAMSAYYLKGVLKGQIELVDIFKGILPYLGIVIFSMVLLINSRELHFGCRLPVWRIHPALPASGRQKQDSDMKSAKQLVDLIRDGKVNPSLVHQSFARIDETDAEIKAWAFLDRDEHSQEPMRWMPCAYLAATWPITWHPYRVERHRRH